MFYLFDIISIYELYFLSQLDKMNMGHFLLSIGRDDCEKLEHHVVFYTESLKVLLKVLWYLKVWIILGSLVINGCI